MGQDGAGRDSIREGHGERAIMTEEVVSHLVTMGIGVVLGVILTVTVIMIRDMWKSKGQNNDDW
jgi:hypothetical protein